ncbi:hypothetical protein ACFVWR_01250 [Leifsonia sp. NPDC058292]|uniref:hypothetical protein n=1 Tax=Leifsonia sp. NPDC058292 TaxID=3346428 RepID=UPI0036DA99D7
MRNTKERKWLYWGLAGLVVPIAAVVFLITTFVSSLPPTRDDARAEAGQILHYVDARDVDALQAYFSTPYPPGSKEFLAKCSAVAVRDRTVTVSAGDFIPSTFGISVDGVSKKNSHQNESCTFGLMKKDNHWKISAFS